MKDIAIVVGGSSGIGKAIVNKLQSCGYSVASLARSFPLCQSGVPAIPVTYKTFKCDVTSKNEIIKTFEKIGKCMGIPKVLIYCAGFVEPKPIMETGLMEWNYQINVNLTGAFLCAKEFLKYSPFDGKIINIASTAGTRPAPEWAAYGAAKAGLINFSLSLSEELSSSGVKVYCVNPGRCATALRRKMVSAEDQRQIMQPENVAEFVVYLVEEESGLLDGQALRVRKKIKKD